MTHHENYNRSSVMVIFPLLDHENKIYHGKKSIYSSENDSDTYLHTMSASSMLPNDSTIKEQFTIVGLPLSREK